MVFATWVTCLQVLKKLNKHKNSHEDRIVQQFTMFLFESTKHDTAVITVFFIELFEVKRKGIHGINFLLVLGENRL